MCACSLVFVACVCVCVCVCVCACVRACVCVCVCLFVYLCECLRVCAALALGIVEVVKVPVVRLLSPLVVAALMMAPPDVRLDTESTKGWSVTIIESVLCAIAIIFAWYLQVCALAESPHISPPSDAFSSLDTPSPPTPSPPFSRLPTPSHTFSLPLRATSR